MALIDSVKALCSRLGTDPGWKALMGVHGLDLAADDLAGALEEPLTVRRDLLGFEDFAEDGVRGIEPGSPSRSLFFHALASPNVLHAPDGAPLLLFPTPAELDAVENYIFGVAGRSLTRLKAAFPKLSVVVFACEYRPAAQTTHRKHADMAYCRTGVARVGTRAENYVPSFRGFHPEIASDAMGVAVLPARYVAYLAARMPGAPEAFLPMRPQTDDDELNFWVPVHKLFPGTECLAGLDLTVGFDAHHVNEKIFRAQQLLGLTPPTTPPFRFTNGLAQLSPKTEHGPGWLVPTVHPHFVAEAKTPTGQDVTFRVPTFTGTWGTIDLWEFSGKQSGPEYLHTRTEVLPGGGRHNLNDDKDHPDVEKRVGAGEYDALHYVDFTGDGQITVDCPQVQGQDGIPAASLPAYSLIAALDPFPACDQRQLTEWFVSNEVPIALRNQIWAQNSPAPLSDQRIPANLQLPGATFDPDETTITAVVALPLAPSTSPNTNTRETLRHSHLADDAAGIFFPGWDVSVDEFEGKRHLAAYGLGSPFPEDSKLCAALSSFWPAVAPDVTRTMDTAPRANLSGTVIPMTDAEIGQVGDMPWDGVPGPTEILVGGKPVAEYNSFVHADYVLNSLADKFTIRLTAKVDFDEYTDRILSMLYGYLALGVERVNGAGNPALTALRAERKRWVLLSFRAMPQGTPELIQAGMDTNTNPAGPIFRATVFKTAPVTTPTDFRKRRMPIEGRIELILAPRHATGPIVLLRKADETAWRRGVIKTA